MRGQRQARKMPPRVQQPHLIMRKEEFIFAFPYMEEAVEDLKRLPLNARRWNKDSKTWHLAPSRDVLLHVLELCNVHYGQDPVLMIDGITIDEVIGNKTLDTSTYYSTLKLEKTATEQEIRKAFRHLATEYHPDKGGNIEHFHKIRIAYEILMDPVKRKKYDVALTIMKQGNINIGKIPRKRFSP